MGTDRWHPLRHEPCTLQLKHQRIATKLATEFTVKLENCEACTAYQPIDYLISDDTILQPDMLIVGQEIKKKYLDFPPVLVAEILSPATALKDRHSKYSIYESAGVPYYLIISSDAEEGEVYAIESSIYVLKQKGKAFHFQFSFGNCNADIDFSKIWR